MLIRTRDFIIFMIFGGIQSFTLQFIDILIANKLYVNSFGSFTWIAFIAWSMYFLVGGNKKNAFRAFNGFLIGILFATFMILSTSKLSLYLGVYAIPVISLITIPFMTSFEKATEMLSSTPSIFIGSSVFFAFYFNIPHATILTAIITVITYQIMGLLTGHCTAIFRKEYLEYINSIK